MVWNHKTFTMKLSFEFFICEQVQSSDTLKCIILMLMKHLYGNWPEMFGFLLKWDEIITVSQKHGVLSVSFANMLILSSDT